MRRETEIFQGRAEAEDQTYKDNKTRFEISVKSWICPQGSSLLKWLGNYSNTQQLGIIRWPTDFNWAFVIFVSLFGPVNFWLIVHTQQLRIWAEFLRYYLIRWSLGWLARMPNISESQTWFPQIPLSCTQFFHRSKNDILQWKFCPVEISLCLSGKFSY